MNRTCWLALLLPSLLASQPVAASAQDGAAVAIAADVAAADTLWQRSCRHTIEGGLCATYPKRAKRKGRACGALPGRAQLAPAARRSDLARRAKELFRRALGRGKQLGATAKVETRHLLAKASFRLGDDAFEHFIASAFPRRLDFSPNNPDRARHQRRFMAYLHKQGKLLMQARQYYVETIKQGRPAYRWRAAAATRIGQIYLRFARDLASAPLPVPPTPRALRAKPQLRREFLGAFEDAFCAAVSDKGRPLARKAAEAAAVCARPPRDGSKNLEPWARHCKRLRVDIEELLAQLDRADEVRKRRRQNRSR